MQSGGNLIQFNMIKSIKEPNLSVGSCKVAVRGQGIDTECLFWECMHQCTQLVHKCRYINEKNHLLSIFKRQPSNCERKKKSTSILKVRVEVKYK